MTKQAKYAYIIEAVITSEEKGEILEIGKKLTKKEKMGLLAAIVIPSVVLGVLLFYSYATSEVKDMALAKYAALKAETDGDKAAAIKNGMVALLATNHIALDALHLEQGELDRRVEGVYYRQSQQLLASLEALKGDPDEAVQLRAKFLHCRKFSGEQKLQADEYINRLVAINYLTVAARQGVRLDSGDLKKAGIIVPAVYRTQENKPAKNKSVAKAISALRQKHGKGAR